MHSTTPESRKYRHDGCEDETVIGEEAFCEISNPLTSMRRTWCVSCNDYFPLSEFVWADTGERITDYHKRHGAKASSIERFICSATALRLTLALGFVIGTVAGYLWSRGDDWLVALFITVGLGVVTSLLLGGAKEYGIGKLISKRVCGVTDTRCLE